MRSSQGFRALGNLSGNLQEKNSNKSITYFDSRKLETSFNWNSLVSHWISVSILIDSRKGPEFRVASRAPRILVALVNKPLDCLGDLNGSLCEISLHINPNKVKKIDKQESQSGRRC